MSTRRALLFIAGAEGLILAFAFFTPRWKGTLGLYSAGGWFFTVALMAALAMLLRQWRYVPLLAVQVWATTWVLYTLFQFPLDPENEFAPQNPQLAMSVMLYLLPHAVLVLLIVGTWKLLWWLSDIASRGEPAPDTT